MNTITYGGVEFPCSEEGLKTAASQDADIQTVENCSLDQLLKLSQPAEDKVRWRWMRRLIADTHWLPLIEVLSGCHPQTNPDAHTAFMKQLVARGIPRIAHRPSSPLDRYYWASRLRSGLKLRVPDPAMWAAVCGEGIAARFNKPHVLFVDDDCVAAAEMARPDCLKELPWLLYKSVSFVKGQLEPDGHRVMMFAKFGDDPSSEAYWRFIKTGKL